MTIILITAAILLTAAVIFSRFEFNLRKTPSAFEYIAEAERLINIGEYASAAEKCSEGLKKYPNDDELYLKKAQAYMLAGDEEKALGTVEFGYKQTGSSALSQYRGENFPVTVSSPEFSEVEGGVFDAPESVQPEKVTDPQNKTEYTAPYPEDDEINVVIPSVLPAPPENSDDGNSVQNLTESENVQ